MTRIFKIIPLVLLISGTVQAATDNPWYAGARVGGTSFDNFDGELKGKDLDKDDWGAS